MKGFIEVTAKFKGDSFKMLIPISKIISVSTMNNTAITLEGYNDFILIVETYEEVKAMIEKANS